MLTTMFYPYYDQNKYRLGSEVLMSTFSTYYMQHSHPLIPQINRVLGRLADSGISLQIMEKNLWLEGAAARSLARSYKNLETNQNIKIRTGHLTTLWILANFGILISIIAFIFELKQMKKEENKVKKVTLTMHELVLDMKSSHVTATAVGIPPPKIKMVVHEIVENSLPNVPSVEE